MSEYAKQIMSCCDAVKEITGISGWDFVVLGDGGENIFMFLKLPKATDPATPQSREDILKAFTHKHDIKFMWISTINDEPHLDIRGYDVNELKERVEKLRVAGADFKETMQLLTPAP